MVVGVVTWQLSLPGCASLKEKRTVVRSLKDRLSHRFNLSVAETGAQDVLTRAELTIALVATDGHFAGTVLDKAERLVQGHGRAVVVATHRTMY